MPKLLILNEIGDIYYKYTATLDPLGILIYGKTILLQSDLQSLKALALNEMHCYFRDQRKYSI